MTTGNCIFCGMAEDPAHPAPIFRDDLVFVLRDIDPKARVYLLIIPNQHLASLGSVEPVHTHSVRSRHRALAGHVETPALIGAERPSGEPCVAGSSNAYNSAAPQLDPPK